MLSDPARARLVGVAAVVVAVTGVVVAVVRDEERHVTTESFCAAVEAAELPAELNWGLQDYGFIERNLTVLSGLAYPEGIRDEAARVIDRTPAYLAGASRTDFDGYDRADQQRDHALGIAMDDDLDAIEQFIDRSCPPPPTLPRRVPDPSARVA